MFHRIKAFLAAALAAAAFAAPAHAQTVLNVYGPGGPGPAMKEAGKAFGSTHNITFKVVAGPTGEWVDKAKQDADVVFSGAENMFTDFAKALPGAFDLKDAYPLYLRPAAILVRPGNPKNIRGFRDLLAPNAGVCEGLVAEEPGQLAHDLAELLRLGLLVAQDGELVEDRRVARHVDRGRLGHDGLRMMGASPR